MTITAIIQARLGSSRLPGKVLRTVNGRPLLSYMLERVRASRLLERCLVATTTLPSDDPIAEWCTREGVELFRGNALDVLDRYRQCAVHAGADPVVRLTADCPLIDPRVIDEVVGVFLAGNFDYVANTCPPVGTFPDGMDVEVFSARSLERAWTEATDTSQREHVTHFFWQNPGLFRVHRHDIPVDLSRYRLTVDHPQDFQLVEKVLADLHPRDNMFSMNQVIDYLDANPDVRGLNAAFGWKKEGNRP